MIHGLTGHEIDRLDSHESSNLLLVAIEPVTLHRIHLSADGESPLCGIHSDSGFEVVGDAQKDGLLHVNSCSRCLRAALKAMARGTGG